MSGNEEENDNILTLLNFRDDKRQPTATSYDL
jgi:hypothetical protein